MKGKVLTVSWQQALIALVLVLVLSAATACGSAAPAPATQKPAAAPTTAAAAAPTKAAEATKPAAQPTAAPAKKIDYPASGKTITVIVPYGTGAALHLATRALVDEMQKVMGTNIVIVNKEGAGSQVGMTELANSKPDGYTLGTVALPSFITTYIDPSRKAAYSRASFEAIAGFTVDPYVLVVQNNSPFKNVKDLVNAAKASPGKIKVAIGGGTMSMVHLSVLMLARTAGVEFSLVFFDNAGDTAVALQGGHVDAASSAGAPFMPGVKNAALRFIGLFDTQGSKFLPGVETMVAQGYDVSGGFVYHTMLAPKGTPKEIVDLLSAAVKKTMDTPSYKETIDKLTYTAQYRNTEDLAKAWTGWESSVQPVFDLAKSQVKK